jgi:hypothetical protein
MRWRPLQWIGMNVIGVLTVAYFVFKFALLLALWVIAGPLAIFLTIAGVIFIRGDDDKLRWAESVFTGLDAILGGIDRVAMTVHGGLDRAFRTTDRW